MRLRFLFVIGIILMAPRPGAAQGITGGAALERQINEEKARRGFGDKALAPVPGTKYNSILITASIPVSFSELKIVDGKPTIGPKMGIGAGAALIIGKAVYNGNKKFTISPMGMIGAAVDTGASEGANGATGRLGLSVVLGLGPVGLSIGRDFVTSSTFFGLNARLEAFDLFEDAFIPLRTWE